MSRVNDEILKELRASLEAMHDDDFNSIMDSIEEAHENGATKGFNMDILLASSIECLCGSFDVALSIDDDYVDEDYQWAA